MAIRVDMEMTHHSLSGNEEEESSMVGQIVVKKAKGTMHRSYHKQTETCTRTRIPGRMQQMSQGQMVRP